MTCVCVCASLSVKVQTSGGVRVHCGIPQRAPILMATNVGGRFVAIGGALTTQCGLQKNQQIIADLFMLNKHESCNKCIRVQSMAKWMDCPDFLINSTIYARRRQ